MLNKIRSLFGRGYKTLNIIEISKDNLIHNFKYLSSLDRRVKIAPVVKSNAYGHGIIEIAKILDPLNAPFFCVDSLYEAYKLLKANIKTPVLIMGYTDTENFKVKKLPFSYALFDLEMARILNDYQPGCGVHIFVDTGMHREGIPLNELYNFLKEIKLLSNIKIEGLMSHLASADDKKDPLNKIQIRNFLKALKICKENGIHPKWIHLFNSDGLALHLRGANVNTARTGLALYGISNDPNLKQVLTFKSKIIQIKKLQKGDRVGYGGIFIAKKPMILGILPIGYYDGIDRRLSNIGWVSVGGKLCKILGRISMNITIIDLSRVSNPHIGQEVNIYPSIKEAAIICKTIPYDILIGLAASTKRIAV